MKTQLHFNDLKILLLTIATLLFQDLEAQCTDSFIRPSDGFQLQGWSPRCHNGTDGEIRITGISSTVGSGNFTNQGYAVRILSGPGAPATLPMPSNAATFTVPGLAAGTYVLDIIDQCGGNSADKTVTLTNPPLNSTLTYSIFYLKEKITNTAVTGCGNTLKFKLDFKSSTTAGNVTHVFTNSTGNTMTFTKAINRSQAATANTYSMEITLPTAFFNGQNVTYTSSNQCGPLQGGTLTLPTTNDMVYGTPSIAETADPQDQCRIGYDIKVFRNFMTNPVTVTVEETANPGTTPLNFLGQPINPSTINLLHLNSAPMNMATIIPLGLKYNTDYTLTFTDACGLTVTKTMVQTVTPFNPTVSCITTPSIADVSGYFDDTAIIRFNSVAISSNAVGPLTLTINSGPSNYTTASGSGNPVTSGIIQYPYTITVGSPFSNEYIAKDNIRTFPTGSYNITITDACGKSSTSNYNVTCRRNHTITHSLQTCNTVTQENIGIKLNVPKALLGTRVSIYKADGSIAVTGIINSGNPFYYVASSTQGTLNVNLPNNTEYYFRYGGVNESGNITEPTQFGGVGALPRLQGGYLYEYRFRAELRPFRFEAIEACGTSATIRATGGTEPYTFSILDGTGNAQLFPNQSSASFSGLSVGTNYTVRVIDACGREFTQQFRVAPLPVPSLGTMAQPTCQTNSGSVTINNLPSDWTITKNPDNLTYSGTTTAFTINGLTPGSYTFSVRDNITLCAENQSLNVTINPVPACPITTNDNSDYTTGTPFTVNVLQNDTTGAAVNPATVSLALQSNSTNVVSNNGFILSMDILGEGTWSVNSTTGQITFQPFPAFTGTPSAIEYNVQDFSGNTSNNATITTDRLPIAVDDSNQYTQGIPVSVNIINNDTLGDNVDPSTISLVSVTINPNAPDFNTQIIQISVPNEGTWSVNTIAGTATFTPLAGFNGVPSAQQYRVKDFEGNLSNIAFIRLTPTCAFEITCPTFPTTTVACYENIPTATQLTEAEFEVLGNANGSIGNTPCGIIEITATNSPYLGCNTDVTRTYVITEYQDTNANGVRDAGENTILNTVNCTQTIRVNDTTAPVFNETLPTNLTLECNAGIPNPVTLTATDNCNSATVTFEEETTNGTCPGNSEIIRTWRTADACGNENTHIQTISILDTTPPVFTGNLPPNQTLECGNIPTAPTLTATDSCGEVTVTLEETEVEGSCKSRYELIRTWTATDACGNTATHTQTLNLNCHVKVFNAVSPDGDGNNDVFYLEGIECFQNNSVEIFNRWGAKVFETQGYDNTSNVFRGKSEGKNTVSKNEDLPTGTYFYILRYDFSADGLQSEKIEKTGYLYVVNN
ncbi:hypothetical protein FLJC2902T_30600 [Flavobacterium limnosediminis JC2902]|uniref:Gliding motility-associated C-terminal domain-containing protein n=1 Tax=Flavobacterium limnosediminis JC2902 TaxID=1341181 RepID=V6SHP1_9FLAO|nr:gliding motility-associated C-terminal domain-containing protein [Flavobacterium limnosediminis]ESU25777.1 hypothetical protein FLJC2902T_30600 [Flavobacterium limnosediminis JC2902]